MARVLSEQVAVEIRRLAAQFPQRQSALLGALFVAQEEAGALSPAVLDEVAEVLGLPATEVGAVASFYHLFHFAPIGRQLIQVCTNVSCLLNGSEHVLRRVKQRLGIEVGETTADGRFTLKAVECLAACELAPMMMIGPDRHGPLTPEKVDEVLQQYAGERPQDGG